MLIEEDDAESSGILMPKKRFATSFDGAHINMVIIGESVFERVDKLPEDVMYVHRGRTVAKAEKKEESNVITREKIARAILAVQKYFWGSSCYAVVYCALRDTFNYDPGMRGFEQEIRILSVEYHFDYTCKTNTIASTTYHNRFMKLNIDKWEKQRANPRYITLAQKFIEAVNESN